MSIACASESNDRPHRFRLGKASAWSNVVRIGRFEDGWFAAIGADRHHGHAVFGASPAQVLARIGLAIRSGEYLLDPEVTAGDLGLVRDDAIGDGE